jgi:F0F1-type ATP synthase epsilon subunit
MANKSSLRVIIKDTENTLYSGTADRVSSFNEVGRFDILPMHANFISMINKSLSIYKDKQRVKEFKLESAILKVKKDSVHIFMGIEIFDMAEDETGQGEVPGESVLKKNEQLLNDWKETNAKRDKLKMLEISGGAQDPNASTGD